MCQSIISTAIPNITRDFHSLGDVGWYGAAMFFPVAATQSVWGKAFKYFPMKTVFLLSIFVFEVGSLICGECPFLLAGDEASNLIRLLAAPKPPHPTALRSSPAAPLLVLDVLELLLVVSSSWLSRPARNLDLP